MACLRQFSEFYNCSPDLLCPEQLRQYFIHLKTVKKVARQTSTQALCAIKLFWEKTLRYLSRYLFKTATANRTVQWLPEGKLLWTYRQSKTRQFTSVKLEPLEFMSR